MSMEISDVEENLNNELKNDFRGMKDGFVQVGERKWFYPSKYREFEAEMKDFEVRPDDVWITGYPRSGTTLTEELVWLLTHNLDFDEWKAVDCKERVRFFEVLMAVNDKLARDIVKKFPEEAVLFQEFRDTLKILSNYKTRRVIKTHLPFELLPPDVLTKGCKVIYVCRYPKDVCVSYFNLQKKLVTIDFCAGFQKFWTYFRNGLSMFGPYFEHVKQGFERIGSDNFMFTFYEEFKKDNRAHIQKLSQFLEIPLTENELNELENFIQIDNFRESRKCVSKDSNNEEFSIIRRGEIGEWKNYFTEEMNADADTWIEMNSKRIGLKYPQYEE